MEKIFISACLLGHRVRYNGKSVPTNNAILLKWKKEGRLLPLCPEISGGLPTPRPASEIINSDPLQILNIKGESMASPFLQGAKISLQLIQKYHIKIAILKDHSPSCGSTHIYDGSFTNTLIKGQGITTRFLRNHGVKVFTENTIQEANQFLAQLNLANHLNVPSRG